MLVVRTVPSFNALNNFNKANDCLGINRKTKKLNFYVKYICFFQKAEIIYCFFNLKLRLNDPHIKHLKQNFSKISVQEDKTV
jgi:hypothetical protein